MDNSSDRKQLIEKILQIEYEKKGFLLEDDIIDICIDHDLDLVEIDSLCDKLLHQRMIVKDTEAKKDGNDNESYVDRSHLDYSAILEKIKMEYPNCEMIIEAISDILPPQTKEWQTIIVEAKNGNSYAKDRMVKMYLRTVMKQAYYFSRDHYCDFEEAFQNGVIGLMNAIDKYDMTSPDLFQSYFPLWVRQYMQRDCIIRGTILRYPTHYKDQLIIIVADACKIMEDDNIEEAVGLVTEKALIHSGLSDEEIYKYILPFVELPEALEAEDNISNMLQGTIKELVDEILGVLTDKESYVIKMRYGLEDHQARTLEEVGSIMGVTRERVRQLEAKAFRKIKASRKINMLKDYL